MRASAWRVHTEVGANAPLICYQGAMAVDPVDGRVLLHERLDEHTAAEAIRFFVERGLNVRVYVEDDVYITQLNEIDNDYAQRHRAKLVEVDDLMPLAKKLPTVVLGICDAREMEPHVAAVTELLGPSAEVTHSLPHFCEVGSPRAGKVRALMWLADYLGLKPDDFVAFGDGLGDLEMIEFAGFGVSVGDAHPAVRSAADSHVAGPDQRGVTNALKALVSEGCLIPIKPR